MVSFVDNLPSFIIPTLLESQRNLKASVTVLNKCPCTNIMSNTFLILKTSPVSSWTILSDFKEFNLTPRNITLSKSMSAAYTSIGFVTIVLFRVTSFLFFNFRTN